MIKRLMFTPWVVAGALAVLSAAGVPQEQPVFSFGVMADIQYRNADSQGTRFYRQSLGKIEDAVRRFNILKPAFVVQLGDLIDGDFASYRVVLPIYEKLTMPGYHVLGNHDFSVGPEDKAKVLQRLGLDKLGGGKGYYAFSHSGWRMVILNGEDLSVVAHAPGSEALAASERAFDELRRRGAKNAQEWNGGVGPAQRRWLTSGLDAAARAGERVIVFCHFPIVPPGGSNLWNDSEIVGILDAHPAVVAYFSGHKHEGDYALRNGIHYLTFQGMVEGEQPAYAVVEVFKDTLRVRGFGRESSRVLSIP